MTKWPLDAAGIKGTKIPNQNIQPKLCVEKKVCDFQKKNDLGIAPDGPNFIKYHKARHHRIHSAKLLQKCIARQHVQICCDLLADLGGGICRIPKTIGFDTILV